MKKTLNVISALLIVLFLGWMLLENYCNKNNLEEYNRNMETHKEIISKINRYFDNSEEININDISRHFTDDFKITQFSAGSPYTVHKNEWINELKAMKQYGHFMHIKLDQSRYEPKLHHITYKFDEGIKIYYEGIINQVEFSGHDVISFKDGKISHINAWADYGGVEKQLYENNDIDEDSQDKIDDI